MTAKQALLAIEEISAHAQSTAPRKTWRQSPGVCLSAGGPMPKAGGLCLALRHS